MGKLRKSLNNNFKFLKLLSLVNANLDLVERLQLLRPRKDRSKLCETKTKTVNNISNCSIAQLTVHIHVTRFQLSGLALVLAFERKCEWEKLHGLCLFEWRRLVKLRRLKLEITVRILANDFDSITHHLATERRLRDGKETRTKQKDQSNMCYATRGDQSENKNIQSTSLRTIWHCCNLFTLNSSCSIVYLFANS